MSGWQTKRKKIPIEVKIGITCFFILFLSYAYFLQAPSNYNVVSRMGLVLSLLEDGTVTINKWHKLTGDKVNYNGNYYSGKAPGLAFTGLPFVAIGKLLLRIYDNDQALISPEINRKFGFLVYMGTICTSGLFTAVAAVLLYFVSLRIGASLSGAVFAALSFGLASPAWGWATAFFGHAMAGACLFIAFAMIFYLDQKLRDKRRDALFGFLAGALLAWAIVVEFTAAIAAVVIMLFGISKAIKWDKKRAAATIISAAIGGIIFIVPLLVYNDVAFGSPFVIGYSHEDEVEFSGMKEGFYGITYPRPRVLWMILFSPYRGILWFSPILVLAPIGIYYLRHHHNGRGIAFTITLISVYYLLMNSAYHYWDGGWSTGPRHVLPMVPFLCLPLAIMWTRADSKWKPGLIVLFSLSFGISLICTSVSMMSPYQFQNPLFDFLIPRFLAGNLTSVLNRIGVPGPLSLMPIFAFWIIGGIYLRRLLVINKRRPLAASV